MEEFKIQPNGYSVQAPQLAEKGLGTIGDAVEQGKTNIIYDGESSVLVSGSIKSKGFKSGVSGWKLNADGTVEFNQ